jgi:uncharacterized repeat protein (TIGR01451 family)
VARYGIACAMVRWVGLVVVAVTALLADPAAAATLPVTTVADDGPGSLRQAMLDANSSPGADTITFDLPGSGPFVIAPATPLPEITDNATTVDGTTQPGYDGRPLLGSGGTVGVDALALPRPRAPIVELTAPTAFESVLRIRGATGTTVRGLHLLGATFTVFVLESPDTIIEDNIVGATGAFGDPGALRSATAVRFRTDSTGGVVRDNLVGFSNGLDCVRFEDASDDGRVEGNEIAGCGSPVARADDAVTFDESAGHVVRGNLLRDDAGSGVDLLGGVDAVTVEDNTVRGNGAQGDETAGIRIADENGSASTHITVARNIISDNAGAGVLVTGATSANLANTISENSIFANAIGIDLAAPVANVDAGDGVTLDDVNDADSGGNGLLNFPVIDSALTGSLVLSGWSPPGARIEFFVSDPTATGFGQGRTFIAARAEGSVDDLDPAVSSFGPGPVGGIAQGADTTSRFRFVLPPVAAGALITATATVNGSTSEFGGVATVTPADADVAVAKTGPARVTAGQTATYTITATNHGPDPADVTVSDPTPAGLALVSVTGACNALPCALGSLPAGASRALTATYQVPAAYAGANPITNTASAATAARDPQPANNTATASTAVDFPAPGSTAPSTSPPAPPPRAARARVALTKRADRTVARPGQAITYTLTVRALTATPARALRICDRLPRTLALIDAPGARRDGRALCWRVASLRRGPARRFTVKARGLPSDRATRTINTASVTGTRIATRRATAAVRIIAAKRPPPPNFTG